MLLLFDRAVGEGEDWEGEVGRRSVWTRLFDFVADSQSPTDFSFFITFTRDTGMRLFDIKYKGDRIVYELGE